MHTVFTVYKLVFFYKYSLSHVKNERCSFCSWKTKAEEEHVCWVKKPNVCTRECLCQSEWVSAWRASEGERESAHVWRERMTVCVKERDRKREGVGGRWAGRRVGRLREREIHCCVSEPCVRERERTRVHRASIFLQDKRRCFHSILFQPSPPALPAIQLWTKTQEWLQTAR